MDKERAILILYGILLGKSLSHEDLIATIKSSLCYMPDYKHITNNEIDEIAYAYEYTYGSKTFEPGVTLTKSKAVDTWFYKKKTIMAPDDHKHQERYEKYLINEHYGDDAKNSIISEAEKVLSLCADPESNEKKRGLVMGDVQSGKTSNYLALANLACDYGYKIILILAGMTDSLRIQTQERTDEGLIGAISSTIGNNEKIDYVGVGVLGVSGYYAIPLTTDVSDFSVGNFTSNDLNKPQILVVKKNKSILEAVKKWLKPGQANISSKNIMIIDDECDNASVNTKKEGEDPSTINGLIRDIYNNFNCSTYVGYTATPFANIFINPEKKVGNDDLFPSDFIHRLKSSNVKIYFGIDKVFKEDKTHWKRIRDDERDKLPAKHKKDDDISVLWETMRKSICMFLICNCIRTIRGDSTKHRSMMINVSPYNKIQIRIKELVEEYVVSLRDAIQQYDKYDVDRFAKHYELKRLYKLYLNDLLFTVSNDYYNGKAINEAIPFEEIKKLLFEEISKFRVTVINNKFKGDQRFKYKNFKETGARVIVIGGFALSRGLTLDGLMTSYYSRNSTGYDTLLQMCRWFGYRPRYEDLCSIYMSQINYDCFCAVSEAIDNLDTQLDMMAARGAAPKEFGLMIKESPETLETDLLITARNKMRNSTEIIRGLNYSGVAIDTSKLYKDPEKNNRNFNAVMDLIRTLDLYGYTLKKIGSRKMYIEVSNSIIADFIESLDIPFENKKFDTDSIASFIRKGEFYDSWDIVFANGDKLNDGENPFYISSTEKVIPVHRSFSYEKNDNFVRIAKSNNKLLEPGIFNSGLEKNQIEEAKEFARERSKKKKLLNEPTPIAEDYLGVTKRRPLLVILPVQLIQDSENHKNGDYSQEKQEIIDNYKKNNYLIGIGVGFAGREGKVMMKFRINKIKQQEYLNKFIESEDEADD